MAGVKRIYVEKKEPFAVKAKELKEELKNYLGIEGIEDVRVLIRYDVERLSDETFEAALNTVFSEPPVDLLQGDASCSGRRQGIRRRISARAV